MQSISRRVFGAAFGAVALIMVTAQGPAWGQSLSDPVAVVPAVRDVVRSEQMFVGSVMPAKRAIVGSAVDGRVQKFPVNEGDRIEAGGTLAQLEIETVSLELAAAEAELELRRQKLLELENGSRPEEIAQAKALKEVAEAQLDYAKNGYERLRNLMTRNSVTQAEFDQSYSAWKAAEATLSERTAAYDMAVAGPRKEQIAQTEAMVKVQEAVVEKLKDQLRKHTVVSPFAGYVVAEHTEMGQWIKSGEHVAEVVVLGRVDVLVHVLGSQVPYVKTGAEVGVEIQALEREFRGTVKHIVPQGDLRSRRFPVLVEVENEIVEDEPVLKSGMMAQVYLPTGPEHPALMVPKDALVLGGKQPTVFVVEKSDNPSKQGTVRSVPVELGTSKDALVEVTGQLEVGDLVVVLGNETLEPGQDVEITRREKAAAPAPSSNRHP